MWYSKYNCPEGVCPNSVFFGLFLIALKENEFYKGNCRVLTGAQSGSRMPDATHLYNNKQMLASLLPGPNSIAKGFF